VFAFLVGEALRDLRRAGRVAVSAIALTALSLTALGGFWLLSGNLDQAVARWRDGVRIVVYLEREPTPLEGAGLVERVKGIPGVASVRFIGKAEALTPCGSCSARTRRSRSSSPPTRCRRHSR